MDRFDLYGALHVLCVRYHSGQWSRGYRILSRLYRAGYNPGMTIQSGHFESIEQAHLYRTLRQRYAKTL